VKKILFALAMLLAAPVMAFDIPEPIAGKPLPWQIDFQRGVTPVKEMLIAEHNMLLVVITAITVFVLALLIYVCWRFRASKNPVPSKTSHNTLIEIIWTTVPVLILVVITIPALRLLYYMDKAEHADMTLKVLGNQWYWTYEYPEAGIKFDSNMIPDDKIQPGQLRLLEVDNRVVVPVGKVVRVQTTAADVNHAWAVPSFGVKKDAIPGKLNETWFRADKEGVYYGQCSELCGVRHGFMPIAVEVVAQEKYDAWLVEAKKKFAN
jgi:cytochrome c oxidase subunit 2